MGVIGYIDPAVEGTTVILSCSPGQILSGPHASTCMENGEWEPDPKKAECIGIIIILFVMKGLAYQCSCNVIIVLETDNKSSSLSQDVKVNYYRLSDCVYWKFSSIFNCWIPVPSFPSKVWFRTCN